MRSATIPKKRCAWASVDDRLLLQYHDLEWAVPVHSDSKHFEVLVLSGAQAGLNWSLVLKKREGYRRAFDKFDPEKVARYSEKRIQTLLSDDGPTRINLVRHRANRFHGQQLQPWHPADRQR
jgi:DNA-3-methyladenine glycosylase I